MPSSANIRARIRERIANSTNRLTVVYSPPRPVVDGTSPAAAPPSPLTGVLPESDINAPAPVPEIASREMPCLWLDAYLGLRNGADRIVQSRTGWRQEATALARVRLEDGLVDVANPAGPTHFDTADHVEYRGMRFQVIATEPVGPSFDTPDSLHVWLSGAHRP